mmetsp:Transcript_29626/g.64171  ORF Transcript_29626/g.64171 Transcript_29626/m.64171 type:complete len:127 (-) Transcript_29626:16-396(-)
MTPGIPVMAETPNPPSTQPSIAKGGATGISPPISPMRMLGGSVAGGALQAFAAIFAVTFDSPISSSITIIMIARKGPHQKHRVVASTAVPQVAPELQQSREGRRLKDAERVESVVESRSRVSRRFL